MNKKIGTPVYHPQMGLGKIIDKELDLEGNKLLWIDFLLSSPSVKMHEDKVESLRFDNQFREEFQKSVKDLLYRNLSDKES